MHFSYCSTITKSIKWCVMLILTFWIKIILTSIRYWILEEIILQRMIIQFQINAIKMKRSPKKPLIISIQSPWNILSINLVPKTHKTLTTSGIGTKDTEKKNQTKTNIFLTGNTPKYYLLRQTTLVWTQTEIFYRMPSIKFCLMFKGKISH